MPRHEGLGQFSPKREYPLSKRLDMDSAGSGSDADALDWAWDSGAWIVCDAMADDDVGSAIDRDIGGAGRAATRPSGRPSQSAQN